MLMGLLPGVVIGLELLAARVVGRARPADRVIGRRLQGRDKGTHAGVPVGRRLGQRPPEDGRHGRGQRRLEGVDVRRRLVDVLEHQHLRRDALKRQTAGQRLEQDNGQAILVAVAGQLAAGELFRTHERGRAQQCVAGQIAGQAGIVHLGNAEVGDIGVALLVEQDVGRLDVAVDNPGVVGRVQSAGHLAHGRPELRPGDGPGHQPVAQRAAAQ